MDTPKKLIVQPWADGDGWEIVEDDPESKTHEPLAIVFDKRLACEFAAARALLAALKQALDVINAARDYDFTDARKTSEFVTEIIADVKGE